MSKLDFSPPFSPGRKTDQKGEEKKYSLMDDYYFSIALKDNPIFTSFILRIILDKKDLDVKSVEIHKSLPNFKNCSPVLDAYATDSKGNIYNIEIQNVKIKGLERRARYYASVIDYSSLKKGKKYKELPDVYIIFFCNFDLCGESKPMYILKSYLGDNHLYDDGRHIIYVNCTYKNKNDDIGKLIHDMKSKVGEKKCYNEVSEQEVQGETKMFKEIRDAIKQGEQQGVEKTIVSFIKANAPMDLISRATKKSIEEINEIKRTYNL